MWAKWETCDPAAKLQRFVESFCNCSPHFDAVSEWVMLLSVLWKRLFSVLSEYFTLWIMHFHTQTASVHSRSTMNNVWQVYCERVSVDLPYQAEPLVERVLVQLVYNSFDLFSHGAGAAQLDWLPQRRRSTNGPLTSLMRWRILLEIHTLKVSARSERRWDVSSLKEAPVHPLLHQAPL